jgi:hypothetical protein
MRNSHPEQMFSALPPKADSSRASRHDRFVPITDMAGAVGLKEKAARRRLFNSNLLIVVPVLFGIEQSSGRHFDAPNRGTLAYDDSRRTESFSACT